MELRLSNTVFEWLLAQWSGHEEDPSAAFPSLQNVDCEELADELALALQGANSSAKVV